MASPMMIFFICCSPLMFLYFEQCCENHLARFGITQSLFRMGWLLLLENLGSTERKELYLKRNKDPHINCGELESRHTGDKTHLCTEHIAKQSLQFNISYGTTDQPVESQRFGPFNLGLSGVLGDNADGHFGFDNF